MTSELDIDKFQEVVNNVMRKISKENCLFYNGNSLCYGEYELRKTDSGFDVYNTESKAVECSDLYSCLSAILFCKYTKKRMTRMIDYVIMLDTNYRKHSMDCKYIRNVYSSTSDEAQKESLHMKYTHSLHTALHYHNEIHKFCRKIVDNGKY